MNDYTKNMILEYYGNQALEKIEDYITSRTYKPDVVVIDKDDNNVICGETANHSMALDDILSLCNVGDGNYSDYDNLDMIWLSYD